jgi:YesN/AraC family two-component response regulator
MTHMDGLQLIEIVRNSYPELRIVAMSAFDEHLAKAQAIGVAHLLKKPFSHNQLIAVIHEIDQPSSA